MDMRVSTLVLCAALAGLPGCGATGIRGSDAPAEVRLLDLTGAEVLPLETSDGVRVFVFVRTDCPISNRYAPEVRDIVDDYASRGVGFWLVYVDPDETVESIRHHLSGYDFGATPLRDPYHALVRSTGATVTPEVAVFRDGGGMAYRGRIDDRYVAFGKTRARPTRHDLRETLDALLEQRELQDRTTRAVGCFITDLDPATPAEGS